MTIAYIVSLFPKISETFILREMIALEGRGHAVRVVSLKNDREPFSHPEARAFERRTIYPQFGSPILVACLWAAARHPLRLAGTVLRVLAAHALSPVLLAKNLALVPIALWLARRLPREGVDHIHAHWASYPATAAWIVSRFTGIPYSVTGHAHDLFLPNPMLAVKVRHARFFAVISEFNRALVIQACGPGVMGRLRLIRCGLPLEEFPFEDPPPRADGAPVHIVSVGRLVDYKGFDVLIEACAKLRQRGRDVRCTILGEGPERGRLTDRTVALGLREVVALPGSVPQSEVRGTIRSGDLFVLACVRGHDGQQDGIPIVLMEAMAIGRPVVSTRISGIPELVKDGRTGLLAAPGDADHLATAIERLLDDPALAAKMRREARRWIETEFDLARSVTQLSDAFRAGRDRGSEDP